MGSVRQITSLDTLEMAVQQKVNYLYFDAETGRRFDLACDELGWAYKSLVQQCLAAYFAKNRAYYVQCALTDAKARGMEPGVYYRTLRDQTEADLKPYRAGRPGFGATPLDGVDPIPTGDDTRRRYGIITLSPYNYVLLQVARLVDIGSMVQLISRIVKQHFDLYWETNYYPQIERDKNESFE